MTNLRATASAMVAPGKGILAADESVATASKRLDGVGIPSTAESRRAYREMLLTTPGLANWVSGVILFEETLRQATTDGVPFADYLCDQGVLPGIKVDTGAKPLAGRPGETVTEGLDGLRERVAEYVGLGASFAKWRAVISIGDGRPSQACVSANAHALARYAALCQEGGLVPIVEPEVLIEGEHTIETCEAVTAAVLRAVFAQLAEHGVDLEAIVLKPSMVVPGKASPLTATVPEVAAATIRTLRAAVPAAVAGVAFLSGGQSAELATAHLDAMNRLGPQPWPLTFSYGRALQDPALAAYAADGGSTVEAGQAALCHRARCNSAARAAAWTLEMETLEPAGSVL
ncbi:MAG: fructose-bisphosphate aldolase, class [Actinomycetota bacterium]|jgi:fructose-bisphosphate aldolase class I|nr:fructose-bisphosphate aldolase, class [Actinomycetota bacterium]MDQ1507068.1 fructose-bisphosphate aldolase, class [Actinomycetota bacterium]